MKSMKRIFLPTLLALFVWLIFPLANLGAGLNRSECPESNAKPEAVQLFEQGREAFEMGRTGDAIYYFEKALQKDAQYATAWLYKAMTAETAAERESSFKKAVSFRNNATEGERILIDMEQTYLDNNPDKRFQLAKRLVELQPGSARTLLVLAGEYQQRGDINKFRDLAFEAIRVEPASPLGYRSLAASWLLNEPTDFSLAEKYMEKFVELRPDEASAYIAKGDVQRAFLNLQDAKNDYSKAIRLEPENAVALSKRGYVNTYLGLFEDARADFRAASELASQGYGSSGPNAGVISYLYPGNGIGTIAEEVASTGEKGNHRRMPLEGQNDNCYFCCTFISMTHGIYASPDKSLNACNSLGHEFVMESRVPGENAIEANIAFIEGFRAIQDKDYEKASQVIEKYAQTISPEMKSNRNEAHNFLEGLMYSEQGHYERALASFSKSDVNNIFVKYHLGVAYHKLERYEEAREVLSQVADFKFANVCETQMSKRANEWLKSYETALMSAK